MSAPAKRQMRITGDERWLTLDDGDLEIRALVCGEVADRPERLEIVALHITHLDGRELRGETLRKLPLYLVEHLINRRDGWHPIWRLTP